MMDYRTALARAEHLQAQLAPHCERIAIAGSIRRCKHEVKDIELVCIPHQEGTGLFSDEPQHAAAWQTVVHGFGRVTSGSTANGKHIKVLLRDGTKLDLYTTTADNWGWRLLLSTGSAEHNIKMVLAVQRNGYSTTGGHLCWKGVPRNIVDEAAAFACAGMRYIEPQFRI